MAHIVRAVSTIAFRFLLTRMYTLNRRADLRVAKAACGIENSLLSCRTMLNLTLGPSVSIPLVPRHHHLPLQGASTTPHQTPRRIPGPFALDLTQWLDNSVTPFVPTCT